ncbi:MAG TPA: P-loop NTPase [Gemmatimonadales bacterium]|nr:P-loop NTPase [Gemmatimonadales bacterium]
MRDQAALLREMMARACPEPVPLQGPPVLVVGSGKGGVGKSVLAALVGVALADQGRRVLLFDADQNLGNLHVLLGVRPAARLDALLEGEVTPEDLVRPVRANLWLLPGDSGAESLYAMGPTERARLHLRLSALYDRFDAVIVDAGAGLEGVVRVSSMRATRLLVVTMPEPAALTDAYALIKIVNLQVPDLPIDVVLNRTDAAEEGRDAFARLATASERFLRRHLRYLGAIPDDPAVRRATREPGRLLGGLRDSPAGALVRELALDRLEWPMATAP